MSDEQKEEKKEESVKMCKLTIVTPGHSDSVIKVFPAEHETEKIWLDKTPGKERWKEVKRLFQLYADRSKPVPIPIYYHDDVSNLATTNVTEEKIPIVKLENYVFKKPKEEVYVPSKTETEAKKQSDEIADLKKKIDEITSALLKQGSPK